MKKLNDIAKWIVKICILIFFFYPTFLISFIKYIELIFNGCGKIEKTITRKAKHPHSPNSGVNEMVRSYFNKWLLTISLIPVLGKVEVLCFSHILLFSYFLRSSSLYIYSVRVSFRVIRKACIFPQTSYYVHFNFRFSLSNLGRQWSVLTIKK
jgi:hypothetical protein